MKILKRNLNKREHLFKKKSLNINYQTYSFRFSAESEGFEPPEPLSSTVFKTAAIDHSANSPLQKYKTFKYQQLFFKIFILIKFK